ncbi:hypothetical protein GW17_00050654, partial [Ensete ventricosum]
RRQQRDVDIKCRSGNRWLGVVQEARLELEPKSIGVPGECLLGGLHGISSDTEEKEHVAR